MWCKRYHNAEDLIEMKTAQRVTKRTKPDLPNFMSVNLRILRKEMGWSQTELASRVGLNRGNIASYESGTAEPSICKALRVSKLFGINPRDMIRRDLSSPEELILARIAHNQEQDERRDLILQHRRELDDLDKLVESSRALFLHKRSATDGKPCAEADMFAMQYEQLYQLAGQLTENYRSLLAEVSCQCDAE